MGHKESSITRCARCGFVVRCEECPDDRYKPIERADTGEVICGYCAEEVTL